MRVCFLGAARTVTGSRYLIETRSTRILVDCGLFQGPRELRERNREPLPFNPADLDAILLTHAHLDHSGYLPVVVREGFRGQVISTTGTRDLCSILLPDSAHLQQEAARVSDHRGRRRRERAPLYDQDDVDAAFEALPLRSVRGHIACRRRRVHVHACRAHSRLRLDPALRFAHVDRVFGRHWTRERPTDVSPYSIRAAGVSGDGIHVWRPSPDRAGRGCLRCGRRESCGRARRRAGRAGVRGRTDAGLVACTRSAARGGQDPQNPDIFE